MGLFLNPLTDFTCTSPSSSNFLPDATPPPSPTPPDNLDLGGNQSSNETLRIGAFNIQVFGTTGAQEFKDRRNIYSCE